MNGYGKVRYFGEIGVDMRGRQMDELIRKKDALDALMTERKRLLANGQKEAEHILTHHGYNVIAELNVPDTNVGDMISRQAAIDIVEFECGEWSGLARTIVKAIKQFPSAQAEIIRCKDCKWYGRADKRRFYRGMDCLQKRIDTIVPDKDFCSRAERRTDE